VRCTSHPSAFSARAVCRLAVGVGLFFAGIALPILGQAIPAAQASPISTGFALPTASGTLSYSVSASESLSWGFYSNSGHSSATNVSGNLGYISTAKRDPFSAVLSAGHSFGLESQPSYNFVSLALSQVLSIQRWSFTFADSVSYMPQTPANGYAGIPGVGDLNVLGLSGMSLGFIPTSVIAPPTQGILTNYANRVDNTVSGSIQRDLTGKTGIHGSASYWITRYTTQTGDLRRDGLDADGISGGGGMNHMYSPRTVAGANFTYSSYTFAQSKLNFPVPDLETETATANYSHQFTRRLQATAAVGPQWSTVNLVTKTTSLGVFANVNASYSAQRINQSLSFLRGANSGYGVIGGTTSTSVTYAASMQYRRVWAVSGSAAYARNSSLATKLLPQSKFDTGTVGVQVSHALPRSLSAFCSYSLENQSSSGSLLPILNAFSGRYQTLGFGITYAPTPKHFGAQ
jgi:hypothetical protein